MRNREEEVDVDARRFALALARAARHELAYMNVCLKTLVTVDASEGESADLSFKLHTAAPEGRPDVGSVRLKPRELGWLVSLQHDTVHRAAEVHREFKYGGAK